MIPSPLQAYRLTPVELALVGHARGVLIDRCMHRLGFEYPQVGLEEDVRTTVQSEAVAISRLYGVSDRKTADTFGYGFPATGTRTALPVERGRTYLRALHGNLDPRDADPSTGDGCAAEADREIGQTDRTTSLYGLAHTLWIEGHEQVLHGAQYQRVRRNWIACMGQKGHRVTDPVADEGDIAAVYRARAASTDEGMNGTPLPGEVALATADVECKAETRFVETLADVSAATGNRIIKENRAALTKDRRRLDHQVALAEAILNLAGKPVPAAADLPR